MQSLVSTMFPGVAAMGNIHPLFVHYPIALLSAFLLCEALGALFGCDRLRTAATWMLYLGTLGAVAAVIAGFLGAEKVAHTAEVHEILERHQYLGLVVLALAVFLSAWRTLVGASFSCKAQFIHIAAGAVMVGVMVFGADLGGLMVYKHGVATVFTRDAQGGHHMHDGAAPVLNPASEVPEVGHPDKGNHSSDHRH